MQLAIYLKRTKISPGAFASAIGVRAPTVYRWLSGDRFPARHLARIAQVTRGSVTANDFVDMRRKGGRT